MNLREKGVKIEKSKHNRCYMGIKKNGGREGQKRFYWKKDRKISNKISTEEVIHDNRLLNEMLFIDNDYE